MSGANAAEPVILRRLFWRAFIVRVAIGLGAWLSLELYSVDLLQDSVFYEELGAAVAADWSQGRPSLWLNNAVSTGENGWLIVAVIAGVYTIFGGLRALPLLLICYGAITALAPGYVYRVTRLLGGDPRAAYLAANVVVFSPSFVFWAGTLYKEGLLYLGLAAALYHGLRLQRGMSWRSVMMLAGMLTGIYALRFYLAWILLAALGLGLLLGKGTGERRTGSMLFVLGRQAVVSAAVLAVGLMLIGPTVTTRVPADVQDALATIEVSRRDLARAESGYLHDVDVSSAAGALRALPIGTAYFLAVPLPWQVGSARQNMAIPETALWILCYPLVVIGAMRSFRRNPAGVTMIVLTSVAMCLFYGLFLGNVGIAYRMRSQVWLLWSVLAAIGWYERSRRERDGEAVRSELAT